MPSTPRRAPKRQTLHHQPPRLRAARLLASGLVHIEHTRALSWPMRSPSTRCMQAIPGPRARWRPHRRGDGEGGGGDGGGGDGGGGDGGGGHPHLLSSFDSIKGAASARNGSWPRLYEGSRRESPWRRKERAGLVWVLLCLTGGLLGLTDSSEPVRPRPRDRQSGARVRGTRPDRPASA